VQKQSLALGALLALCVPYLSFSAFAQQPTQVHRVAFLSMVSPNSSEAVPIFKKEFRDLGYIEGQNLAIDVRWAEGRTERLPSLAAELVALKPDVIVTFTTDGALAAKQATTSIPIVMMQVSDPVGSGLIASLAHPGGNITGITDYGVDLTAKYVELIRAVAPKAVRIGILMSDTPIHPPQVKGIEAAAKSLGLTVLPAMERSNEELEQAFPSLAKDGAGALIVLGGSRQASQRARIAELAVKFGMPTLFPIRTYVEKGGLMSYGPNLPATYKLSAKYVDKILKGAKPADLPVEQPPTFELVINLKTARALGITIPQSLLLRADEVIQ
jgi:putative tryptophan/tyrosine transport system substrate-binding protein